MIIPPSLLFQYELSAPGIDGIPRKQGKLLQLPAEAGLFIPATLNAASSPLDVRLAWNAGGLGLSVRLRGKKITPSGRWRDLKTSDHIQVFIDTRHTANVHRATEYCSAIVLLPMDEDAEDGPTVQFVEIAQQRSSRKDQHGRKCRIHCELLKDGYLVELWIPASQLHGYAESSEIGHIGFYVVVHDTELGQLPLSVGGDFPVSYDPSTWIPVRLLKH